MWLAILVVVSALQTRPFKCSLVIDKADQDGIYLSDYCPKMKHCAEGAHTMCMYYNPNRVAGPRCSHFQNISVSAEIAEQLLSMVNEMRGRVAMGMETGRGNVTLPRAYGLFQLKWDNELATFAQVLANTCILRHDLCRATKNFANPGQLASVVRFSIPDWLPVLHKEHFTTKGLTSEKIQYAANEAYKSWYQQKQHVTVEMVNNVPDWLAQPSRTFGETFLQLMDGKATHMGCGVSAYVEYAYHGKNANEIIFNTIHIVCNLSSQPRPGTSVYNMNETSADDLCPPGDKLCKSRYSSNCGCPPGTAEDDRCLCTDPIIYNEKPSCGKDRNCKPAVVLLPIFTVEDAPQHMIDGQGLSDGGRQGPMFNEHLNTANSNEWERNEVLDSRRQNQLAFSRRQTPNSVEHSPTCHHNQHPSSYIMNSIEPPFIRKRVTNERIYQSKDTRDQPLNQQTGRHKNNHAPIIPKRRTSKSIFTSASKFKLHNTGSQQKPLVNEVRKDVAPRKDFTNAKKALDKYLNEKRQREPVIHALDTENVDVGITPETTESTKLTIRPRFKNTIIKAVNHNNPSVNNSIEKINLKHPKRVNQFSKNKFAVRDDLKQHIGAKYVNGETDKKLLNLLDNLEQEVKHVALDSNVKEILDAKIKKIYGSVVGESATPYTDTDFGEEERNYKDFKYESDYNEALEYPNKNEMDRQMSNTEDMINELHSKTYEPSVQSLYARPLPRVQNTLRPIIKNRMDYVFRNTFGDIDEFKNKISSKDHKRPKNYKNTKYRQRTENNDRVTDDGVKSLPLNIQYRHTGNRQKYNNLNKDNTFKDHHNKINRADDEKNRDLNRIDDQKVQYEEDLRLSDYDDDKRNYNYNGEVYNRNYDKNYEKDYAEDPLSSERRRFYQEKLDNLEKIKYSSHVSQSGNIGDATRRRLLRQPYLGLSRNRTSSQRYYLPNRASRQSF